MKIKLRKFKVIFVFIFLISCGGNGNLISNGGFEKGIQEDFAENFDKSWIYYKIAGNPEGRIVEDVKKNGESSYCFTLGKAGRAFLHSQPFKVTPSGEYQVSGWVKTENAPIGSVFLRIFWFKDMVGVLGDQGEKSCEDTRKLGGNNDWKKLEKVVEVPGDCNLAYLRLEPNSGESGDKLFYQNEDSITVWFDDIKVKKLNKETSQ